MSRVENSNRIVRTLFHMAINSKNRSLKRYLCQIQFAINFDILVEFTIFLGEFKYF